MLIPKVQILNVGGNTYRIGQMKQADIEALVLRLPQLSVYFIKKEDTPTPSVTEEKPVTKLKK